MLIVNTIFTELQVAVFKGNKKPIINLIFGYTNYLLGN